MTIRMTFAQIIRCVQLDLLLLGPTHVMRPEQSIDPCRKLDPCTWILQQRNFLRTATSGNMRRSTLQFLAVPLLPLVTCFSKNPLFDFTSALQFEPPAKIHLGMSSALTFASLTVSNTF